MRSWPIATREGYTGAARLQTKTVGQLAEDKAAAREVAAESDRGHL